MDVTFLVNLRELLIEVRLGLALLLGKKVVFIPAWICLFSGIGVQQWGINLGKVERLTL